jgi:hypothetical protein
VTSSSSDLGEKKVALQNTIEKIRPRL